jgi:hypothetical protein
MGFSFDASGLSRHQAAVMAAVMACKPCCAGAGVGSGSGSDGNGGGVIIPCCESEWVPGTASWEVTGVVCDHAECLVATQGAADSPGCEAVTDALPAGWQLRGGVVRFAKECTGGGLTNNVVLEVCCAELIADPTQSELWLSFSIGFNAGAWSLSYQLITNLWDTGSCESEMLEIANRPLELAFTGGVVTCDFPDPRVTLVLT